MPTVLLPRPEQVEPGQPSCEQVMPDDSAGGAEEGKIGRGPSDGSEQQPLQGGGDPAGEQDTGAEGDGT